MLMTDSAPATSGAVGGEIRWPERAAELVVGWDLRRDSDATLATGDRVVAGAVRGDLAMPATHPPTSGIPGSRVGSWVQKNRESKKLHITFYQRHAILGCSSEGSREDMPAVRVKSRDEAPDAVLARGSRGLARGRSQVPRDGPSAARLGGSRSPWPYRVYPNPAVELSVLSTVPGQPAAEACGGPREGWVEVPGKYASESRATVVSGTGRPTRTVRLSRWSSAARRPDRGTAQIPAGGAVVVP